MKKKRKVKTLDYHKRDFRKRKENNIKISLDYCLGKCNEEEKEEKER